MFESTQVLVVESVTLSAVLISIIFPPLRITVNNLRLASQW